MNVSQAAICTKALSLFNSLKEEKGDQSIIATFKSHYLWYTFEMLIEATDKEESMTVKDFW